jgi:2'-5' RNA ligase
MSGLAIVALPAMDDRTWKVSSEKAPHLTLLFLGDQNNDRVVEIAQYLEHAVKTSLHRFSMTVDRRGTLGPDDADVLFLDKSYDKTVEQFRANLLGNRDILEAYNSTEQYSEWTPHLTLGYPETPANILGDEPIHWVDFDRIALWTGDFEGPEFRLKREEFAMSNFSSVQDFLAHQRAEADRKTAEKYIAHQGDTTIQDLYDGMSDEDKDLVSVIVGAAVENITIPEDDDIQRAYDALPENKRAFIDLIVGMALMDDEIMAHGNVDEFLVHTGLKGMKWGVRKDGSTDTRLSKSNLGKSKEARKEARANVKAGKATLGEAHLAAVKSTGHRVTNALLGDKTYWKRAALFGGIGAAAVGVAVLAPGALPASLLIGAYSVARAGQTANNITNLARAIRGNARVDKSFNTLGNAVKKRQDAGSVKVQQTLRRDGGLKTKLKHFGFDDTDAFFAHFGIKGQKWGVRRNLDKSSGAESGGDTKNSASTDEVTGGTGHPGMSADAERALKAITKPQEQLSDREIKEAVNRANQLQQYNKLFGADNRSSLQRQVDDLKLQKDLRDLKRELTPDKRTKVEALVKTASTGFAAYKAIDSVTGGNLSASLTKKMGLVPKKTPTEIEKAIAALNNAKADRIESKNRLYNASTNSVKSKAELNKTLELLGNVARGDLPSQGSGKSHRAAPGRHANSPLDGYNGSIGRPD